MNSTYVLCPVPESDEFLRLKRKPSRTEYAYGDVEVTIGYVDAKESPWHFRPRFCGNFLQLIFNAASPFLYHILSYFVFLIFFHLTFCTSACRHKTCQGLIARTKTERKE